MPTPTAYLNDAVFQTAPTTRQMWLGTLLTNWPNYLILRAETSNMATALYSAFRFLGGSTDYQVPVGRYLRLKALVITIYNSGSLDTTSSDNHLGYGDTAIGYNSAALPTNAKRIDTGGTMGANNNTAGEVIYSQNLSARVPGSKYPYISNGPIFPGQNGYTVSSYIVGVLE